MGYSDFRTCTTRWLTDDRDQDLCLKQGVHISPKDLLRRQLGV